MTKSGKRHFRLSGAQTILLGFVILILAGAFLLMLPFSSRSGEWTSVTDALFTATSASCVTGLVLYDTWSHWTWFGQLVILSLIQIGGMGVVTMTTVLSKIVGKRLGLQARTTMQEAVSAPNLGEIMKYTRFIFLGCMIFEVLGAVALSPVFISEYGPLKGIWLSVFTSISAFCNAGFDLNGTHGEFSSMTPYMDNPVVVITLVFLILTGGLGFLTWMDIRKHGFKFYKYSTQSKLIIVMELLLVFIPMIYLWFGEYGDYPANQRFLASLFQAVTPRTAGFNTQDLSTMNQSGTTVMIFLMLIGGSPGSTAGGMKTTTIAVLFMSAITVFGRRNDVQCLKRRVSDETVRTAGAILFMYLFLSITTGIIISRVEGISLLKCLFETGSAIGTVGLTLGVTSTLSSVSRVILMMLMFFGRVGGLTLIYAALPSPESRHCRMPLGKISVG